MNTNPEKLAGETGGATSQSQDIPILLSERRAAVVVGLSPRKLFDLRNTNAIPHLKVDRRVLYPVAGLNAWIEAGCPTSSNAAAALNWTGGTS